MRNKVQPMRRCMHDEMLSVAECGAIREMQRRAGCKAALGGDNAP